MIEYDSKVLYEFAGRLYKRAATLALSYTLVGALLGFLMGASAAVVADSENGAVIAGVVLALVFGAIGYAVGREKGFTLRLQAQTALCQAQIEANTRARTA